MSNMQIGLDVGGTKCLGVVLDNNNSVVASLRYDTPPADQLIDTLCAMVSTLKEQMPDTGKVTVGVGVAGLVTFDGVFRASPNIEGVVDLPIAKRMSDQLNVNVRVDNDATATAFGEWQIGAARGVSDALVVTLGTGIGGGIISGGQLQRGGHGYAGEFGHIIVNVDGPRCGCGQNGCWELYASGSALRTLSGGQRGEEVMEKASRGDEATLLVVEEFSEWVGRGLAGLANALDPLVIVIGGGVVRASEVFLGRVSHYLAQYLYGGPARDVPNVVPAQLGDHAGAIGSALLGALQ